MRFNRQGPRRGLHRHASAREEGGGAHSHRGLKQSFVVVVNALIIIIIMQPHIVKTISVNLSTTVM